MPVRPKDESWADETREAEELTALDSDDDPDSLAGEEIDDPLEDGDDGA